MSLVRLPLSIILLASVLCLAAESNYEPPEQNKAEVLHEVAQNWIQVGVSQFKKGLYEQAEKSFLNARGLQEYLSAQEHKNLEEHIGKTHRAVVERKAVLENIQKAKDLLNKGRPIEARVYYEKARNSPYLTEQERRQIANELKKVDTNFDRQKKEITDLYNRSVEFYREGELEKAREGFVEVARYGLLVTPEGQTPEDYLIQIDTILTEKLRRKSTAGPDLPRPNNQGRLPAVVPSERIEPELLPIAPAQQISPRQTQSLPEEMTEVAAVAEPGPAEEKPGTTADEPNSKTKIIQAYTKANVEDAEARVKYLISRGELNKAITTIRNATEVVKEYRPFIGDELFAEYSIRLKQLADNVIEAGKSS